MKKTNQSQNLHKSTGSFDGIEAMNPEQICGKSLNGIANMSPEAQPSTNQNTGGNEAMNSSNNQGGSDSSAKQ